MPSLIVAAGLAMAILAGQSVASQAPDCETLRPKSEAAASDLRPVTTLDIARLRDIGPQGDLAGQASSLGISPDGRQIAFILRQADPGGNRYCSALFVVGADGRGEVRAFDDGGEVVFGAIDFWGIKDYPTGVPIAITPKWSADGRQIAYLGRFGRHTGVRVVTVASGEVQSLSLPQGDIDAFEWTEAGVGIVVRARTDRDAAQKGLRTEGLSGYRYDNRFMPMASPLPFPEAAPEFLVRTFASDGSIGMAAAQDRERVMVPPGALEDHVAVARVSVSRDPFPARGSTLVYENVAGRKTVCHHLTCSGAVVSAWVRNDGTGVVYLSREGWADEMTAAYLWSPGKAPRRVWATRDLVTDCHLVRRELVCLVEGSLAPRRIVAFALKSGTARTVFDPNPEFSRLRLATATRLHWRNDRGLPVIGDLVRPVAAKPDDKVPLVVVQYVTRGFLRGGTGDEYPIQALASAGVAVLSFQRPADVATLFADSAPDLALAAQFQDWADRRSVHSALLKGLDVAIAQGGIDPDRIGITGLSDGASTVQFALVNSRRFKAAALSTCCQDPKTQMLVTGPATAQAFRRMGFPKSTEKQDPFWAPYSIAMNASSVKTPVLMQLAEDEYMAALEAYTALTEFKVPAELYVFPGERHIKWQPAHRLAVYDRNIAWFTRWLKTR